jgi:hypothetical protein
MVLVRVVMVVRIQYGRVFTALLTLTVLTLTVLTLMGVRVRLRVKHGSGGVKWRRVG